jgi:hypothetical protein
MVNPRPHSGLIKGTYMRATPIGLLLLGACNTPPAALQVSIGPGAPTTTEDLVAEIAGELVDPDGDEVSTSFTWYQDDEARPDLTELTVPASETAKGQRWKLFVLPSDGKLDGPPSEAEILVLNTAPVVETVTLEPSAPLTSEDVVASVEASDADEDAVDISYSWQLDGAETGYQEATLPASATARGDVWTLHVIPSDGEDEGEELLASVSIDNTAPSITSIILDETEVFEADTIGMVVYTEDEDGDAVGLDYAWYADGVLVQQGPDGTLSGERFDKHQEVLVTVTPNDGFVDGEPVSAGPVSVLNSSPSITTARVQPQDIYEASELSCLGEGWADDDDDPEGYQVTWTVNGVDVSFEQTLSGEHFDRGDNITCTLVPDDGEDQGDAVASEPITVRNTAPVISAVTLSPASPAEGDTVTTTVTVSDDDGDGITHAYAWFVDGVQVATTESIDSSLFDKGQDIHVEVTPSDDTDTGVTVTSTAATAVNTPPVIDSVVLLPTGLYTDDTVSAEATASDADGDEVTIRYAWTVDGVDPGVTATSLPGTAYFDKHQSVAVTVTPNDGETDGSPISDSATVLNSPPTSPVLTSRPEYPEAMVDDIVCSIETPSTDADGDSVSYSFAWDVDGVPYLAGGGADTGDTASDWIGAITTTEPGDTVPGEDTRDNQTWTCTVTPDDGTEDGLVAEATTVSRFLIAPQVDCGRAHTCLLDQGGQITCWGRDTEGQATPPSGDFSYVAVADDDWTCAIDEVGAIQCWGDATDGRGSPPSGTFVQLSGGQTYMLGLDDSGQVHCWGQYSSSGCQEEPSGKVQVEAGEGGACAVSTSGGLYCWGSVEAGVDAVPSGTFTKVEYAWLHACALDTSGTVHCWGDDTEGRATPPSGTFCDIGVGEAHSCAMDCSGAIQCWGRSDSTTPPTGSFIQMDVGDYYSCAVDSAGLVQCWGNDAYGQSTVPSEIAGP